MKGLQTVDPDEGSNISWLEQSNLLVLGTAHDRHPSRQRARALALLQSCYRWPQMQVLQCRPKYSAPMAGTGLSWPPWMQRGSGTILALGIWYAASC